MLLFNAKLEKIGDHPRLSTTSSKNLISIMSAPNLDRQSPDPEHQSDAQIGVISDPNNHGAKEDYENDKTSSEQWLNKLNDQLGQ
ncbi:hypothetical protein LTR56_025935 [Elasticomyces elasticus]|nr:hypothetical protein LTR56_025935 [Elasticomyces elasticus]